MRLIDADALEYSLGPEDEDGYVRELLKDAPTVPAVPIRRTKPVLGVSRDQAMNWWQCGNCESVIDQGDRYCRGCGAEVDWNGVK